MLRTRDELLDKIKEWYAVLDSAVNAGDLSDKADRVKGDMDEFIREETRKDR